MHGRRESPQKAREHELPSESEAKRCPTTGKSGSCWGRYKRNRTNCYRNSRVISDTQFTCIAW